MNGSMQWFRWHHGSVTDPKFNLVAKKSGATLPEVLAVWAFLLEAASASAERGHYGEIDCEAVDCLFGMADGKTASIMNQMQQRGLIEGGAVSSWEKRQPKRERDDDNSTKRVQAFREKQRQDRQRNASETPCNTEKRRETPREEEIRVEESNTPPTPPGGAPDGAGGVEPAFPNLLDEPEVLEALPNSAGTACTTAGAACLALKAAGIADTNPSSPKLRALLTAGADLQEFIGAAQAAVAAGNGRFAYVLAAVAGERERAAKLASKLHQGQMPVAETPYQRSMRERVQQFAPSIARKAPEAKTQSAVEFFNAIEVPTRTVGAIE